MFTLQHRPLDLRSTAVDHRRAHIGRKRGRVIEAWRALHDARKAVMNDFFGDHTRAHDPLSEPNETVEIVAIHRFDVRAEVHDGRGFRALAAPSRLSNHRCFHTN